MDVSQIYAIAAGSLFLALLIYHLTSRILRYLHGRTIFFFLKHFAYPYIFQRHRFIEPVTREHLLFQIAYWCVTAACNVIGVKSMSEASTRAATLSVINFIPLLFTGRLSHAADLFGMSLRGFYQLHRSIGFMAVIQGLVHILILLKENMISIREQFQIYGILGGASLGLLCLFPLLRRPFYELFSLSHYTLALLATFALWRHLTVREAFARIYVLIATGILVCTTLVRWTSNIFRNVAHGKSLTTAYIRNFNNNIQIWLALPRPWKIRAGQYIYLWMPGVSVGSVFQSHPFMISWWHNDIDGNAEHILLLIQPKSGFTEKLRRHDKSVPLLAWIDGPYGQKKDINNYGNVIMFATGMGIAAQMPYLKELVNEYQEYNARTRRISLIWQLDKETDEDWVKTWMDELLEADKGSYIFQSSLYVLRDFDGFANYGDVANYGEHDRVRKFYGRVDLPKLINTEMEKRRGKMLITVSADHSMRDEVRALVQRNMSKDVELMELDYQPTEARSVWSFKREEVQHRGVI